MSRQNSMAFFSNQQRTYHCNEAHDGRNDKDKPIGLLCINLDVTAFKSMERFVKEFLGREEIIAKPSILFKDDWQERVNHYVHNYLQGNHLSLKALTRDQKRSLVKHLASIGAFRAKNSANYIAQIVGISRATVYKYLGKSDD